MRGSKKGKEHITPGRVNATCGKCPCCRIRARYSTKKWHESMARRQRNLQVTDEELERRILAKPLR